MPNDVQPTPDDLRPKEQDDSRFVTEGLAKMKPLVHRLLAVWFVLVAVLAIGTIIRIWPTEATSEKGRPSPTASTAAKVDTLAKADAGQTGISELVIPITSDQKYLLVALLFGILGGATHGLASLMDFRGQRRLFRSWSLWYFALPFLGGMLAVIFYVSIRAGLLTGAGDTATGAISIYGIAAISAVVGLFTDRATNKLKDVIDTLLTSKVTRGDELTGGASSEAPPQKPGAEE